MLCVLGVSLTDDEADNTQGSRYCLVAIGRLQVAKEQHFHQIVLSLFCRIILIHNCEYVTTGVDPAPLV